MSPEGESLLPKPVPSNEDDGTPSLESALPPEGESPSPKPVPSNLSPSSEEVATDTLSIEQSPDEQVSQESDIEFKIKSFIPPYIYDPSRKKDPFLKPEEAKERSVSVESDPKERLHPVEFESIDDIKLRAILWSQDGVVPRVLLETSDNKTYTLTKNDRIGTEKAIIYRIDQDRIWAMRPFIDPGGGTGYRPYEKRMSSRNEKSSLIFER